MVIGVVLCAQIGVSTVYAESLVGSSTKPEVSSESSAFKKSDQQWLGLMHTFSCLAEGVSLFQQPCFESQQGHGALSTGIIPSLQYLILFMGTTPPLSVGTYVNSVAEKFSPVATVNAQVQGSGSSVISVVFIFWQYFRNLAYILMTIIFVVVGLFILFGKKVGSQGVVTIQSALPGLAIGLVMITFSYFFAAALTDIAFLGSRVAGKIFSDITFQGKPISQAKPDQILNENNIIGLYLYFAAKPSINMFTENLISIGKSDDAVGLLIRGAGGYIGGQVGHGIGSSTANAFLGPILGGIGGGLLGFGVYPEFWISAVLYFVLVFAIVFSLFKITAELLLRYIKLLFLTILAPMYFMVSSLPGNSSGYTNWMKQMLCQILPFPAVFIGFYFAAYFIGYYEKPFFITSPAVFSNGSTMPLFGGFDLSIVTQLIGYGILLALPSVPDQVCKLVKPPDMGELFGKEIQTQFSSGRSRFSDIAGAGTKYAGSIGKARQEGRQSPPRPSSGPSS